MSTKKQKYISDEIAELLKPRELLDPENEGDTSAARTNFGSWSDEEADQPETSVGLSDFRRKNVKDVTKSHKKYKGEAVSRADLEKDSEDEEESNLSGEEEESEEDLDDEDFEEEENDAATEDDEMEVEDDDNDDEEDSGEEETDEDEATDFQTLFPNDPTENIKKGKSVKNQLAIWEKLLEMRIKSQKLLLLSNSIPFGEPLVKLQTEEDFRAASEKATKNVQNLVTKMNDLKSLLRENFPETRGMKRKAETEYRNTVLRKWHDRTKVANSKTKETQDIIQKIENAMLNRGELLRKVQTYRAGYKIIGHPELQEGAQCAEIYDDADFYHNLLRELIEFKTSTSDQPDLDRKLIELQSLRSKMKKKVDTHGTKGRKIRYVVHNKLINFMAPTVTAGTWTEEARTELYNSLFDKANS